MPTPDALVLGSTSLGAAPELTLVSKQTCHTTPLKAPPGYMLSGTEGTSRQGHQHHSPSGGGEMAMPFSPPLLPSGASPLGQRAEGGWGDWVGQPAQPGQREEQ